MARGGKAGFYPTISLSMDPEFFLAKNTNCFSFPKSFLLFLRKIQNGNGNYSNNTQTHTQDGKATARQKTESKVPDKVQGTGGRPFFT